MRVLIQRISHASVLINNTITRSCGLGFLLFLGVEHIDNEDDAEWLCKKISNLRLFPDEQGVMNKSICEVNGELMIISQFTLHASTRKGNRPSYIRAAAHEQAKVLYEDFCQKLSKITGINVVTGEFGADMKISLVNNGPVTILLDSQNKE
jgi:D-aminoacyl-tRNA deacylase